MFIVNNGELVYPDALDKAILLFSETLVQQIEDVNDAFENVLKNAPDRGGKEEAGQAITALTLVYLNHKDKNEKINFNKAKQFARNVEACGKLPELLTRLTEHLCHRWLHVLEELSKDSNSEKSIQNLATFFAATVCDALITTQLSLRMSFTDIDQFIMDSTSSMRDALTYPDLESLPLYVFEGLLTCSPIYTPGGQWLVRGDINLSENYPPQRLNKGLTGYISASPTLNDMPTLLDDEQKQILNSNRPLQSLEGHSFHSENSKRKQRLAKRTYRKALYTSIQAYNDNNVDISQRNKEHEAIYENLTNYSKALFIDYSNTLLADDNTIYVLDVDEAVLLGQEIAWIKALTSQLLNAGVHHEDQNTILYQLEQLKMITWSRTGQYYISPESSPACAEASKGNPEHFSLHTMKANLVDCLKECYETLVMYGKIELNLHKKLEALLLQTMIMSTSMQQNTAHNADINSESIKPLLLHAAIISGQENIVIELLQDGASWQMRDNTQNYTALHVAALLGHNNIINLLMEQFEPAVDKFNSNKVLQNLLAQRADYKTADWQNETPQDVITRRIKTIKADLDNLHVLAKQSESSKQDADDNSELTTTMGDLKARIHLREQQLVTLQEIADLVQLKQSETIGYRQSMSQASGSHFSMFTGRKPRTQYSNSSKHSSSDTQKRDTCRAKINFKQLEAAEPILGWENDDTNLEWKKDLNATKLEAIDKFPPLKKMKRFMHLETCIEHLNAITSVGIIPPRRYMNAIIKKFQAPGRSTDDVLWRLYNIVCEKFKNIPCDDIDYISTHSEMMLAIVRRNEFFKTETEATFRGREKSEKNLYLAPPIKTKMLQQVINIYNTNAPHSYTYNVLLEAYLKTQQYESYNKLFNERPDFHDDWTFSYDITLCNLKKGKDFACQTFLEHCENYPNIIGGNTACSLLKLFKKDSHQKFLEIYNRLPENLQANKAVLQMYIKRLMRFPEYFHEARGLYDGIEEKKQSIYETMIEGYSEHAQEKNALEIYKQAVEEGYFETHKPYKKKDPELGEIWNIDLHGWILRGEVSAYEAISGPLMKVSLLHYKPDLIQYALDGPLQIICGIGTGKAKASIKKIFQEEFGFEVFDHAWNEGCLICKGDCNLQSKYSDSRPGIR